jgi:hypothetical protein
MTFAPAMIPGERQPGALTRSPAPGAINTVGPAQPSTMDAAVTAERQREGGGAPRQRRPERRAWPWSHPRLALQQLVAPTRTLFGWRLRANDV